MKRALAITLVLVAAAMTTPTDCSAADAEAIAKRIGRFANANLVIRVNVERLNPEQMGEALSSRLFSLSMSVRERVKFADCVAAMKEQDVDEAFIVLRLIDVPTPGPIMLMPTKNQDAARKVQAAVAKIWPAVSAKVVAEGFAGPMLLVGESDALNSIHTWDADAAEAQKQLIAGFEAVGDRTVQVVGRMSKDDRRVVREILHVLPEEVGGGPVGEFVDGVHWISIGANLPPKPAADIVMQCSSAEAATVCQGRLRVMFDKLAESPEAKKAWPQIGELMRMLRPQRKRQRLEMRLSEDSPQIASFLAAVTEPLENAQVATQRQQAFRDLKMLALAMHNYYDGNRKFPPAGSKDEEGGKLLSWRVHLLPYLEQKQLYDEFRLDEPWDSEHNKKLIAKMPKVFLTPGSKLEVKQGRATYRVPSGEGTIFPADGEGTEFREIIDGSSNTALIVEVDDEHAVVWTKPEGHAIDAVRPHAGLGGRFEGVILIALADGSARAIKTSITAEMLNNVLNRADRNRVELK